MTGQETIRLLRRRTDRPLISLVPMIDVMLILLVFFMVTSTYLNLDMIPFVQRTDEPAPDTAPPDAGTGATFMVRLAADGNAYVRGRAYDPPALSGLVADRLAENPLLSVVLLPSPRATTQNLVTVMDTLTRAGATRIRLVQVEPRP